MPPFPSYTRKIRGGVRPLYLEYWPNSGAGALLFYPGTLLCPWQYRILLSAFRAAGFAVAAPHFTGHGRNRHRVSFCFDDLLDEACVAERWLRRAGHPAVAAGGHSQGGILALAHAAASPALAAVFPISAVLPHGTEAIALTHFARLAVARPKLERAMAWLARRLPHLPVPVPAYLSPRRLMAGACRRGISRRGMRLAYPLQFLASLFLARIPETMQCPVHMFAACDDALFTPAIIAAGFARLRAPRKQLHWLPGGGHLAAMNSVGQCQRIARAAAACCAGLGLPLRLSGPAGPA